MTQLFISLPVADLERSNAYYSALGFAKNPALSDHNGTCFIVEEGQADVNVGGESKGSVGPGEYFGEIALINESPRTATLTARTDMVCYGMTPWDFRPLVETNSTIAWKLLTAMAEKMR